MLQAVIFDFDGVIADSEFLHYKALNAIFQRFGVDIPKTVHWEKYLGYTDRENIEAVNRDYEMGLDAAAINEQISEKKIVFDEMAKTDAVIFDGVAKFIQMLTDNKVRIAICSGALRSDIDLMLAGTDFKDVFEVIVTADDVTHGKPDPEGYLLVLNKLNQNGANPIKANQCIVIEDSHWGLEAAAAAGMRPIAVTNTYSREELEQVGRKVVARLDELTIDDLRELCL
ncbi:MAG: HAD family hydrolase [Planctomycetota bacterium]|jgi:beta-phosphoglucomutase